MAVQYNFDDATKGDVAIGWILNDMEVRGLKHMTQDINGSDHQKYLFFPKDAVSFESGKEVATLEYNGLATPAYMEMDGGTSKDKIVLENWAGIVAADFGGVKAMKQVAKA